jgi:hypothetical protein
MNPVEVGMALRSARERERLSLEEIRDRTDVPKVDLDALERGQLDIFHVEQAAVVGVWRYAEALNLDPNALVEVLHRFWTKPSLSIEALGVTTDLGATPIAQLTLATSMLSPISRPRALTSGSRHLGLSKSMRDILSAASIGATRAVATIGPGRPPKGASGHALGKGSSGSKGGKSSSAKAARISSGAEKSKKAALAGAPHAQVETKHETPMLHVAVQEPTTVTQGAQQGASASDKAQQDDATNEHTPWPKQAVHVLADRFGIDHHADQDDPTELPPLH